MKEWEQFLLYGRDLGDKMDYELSTHGLGKPTDVFNSPHTLSYLSRHPNSSVLWCFGDDHLPLEYLQQLLAVHRLTGMSVASRKDGRRFNGVLKISPMFDAEYTIVGWNEEYPTEVVNPPMVIAHQDLPTFLENCRDFDTGDVLVRTFNSSRPLLTIPGHSIINMNTPNDLDRVCDSIGCERPKLYRPNGENNR
jgi:hypothetical protein